MAKARPIDAPRTAYQVLGHLHVDGTNYVPNRDKVVTVELSEDEAAPLIATGVVQPLPKDKPIST